MALSMLGLRVRVSDDEEDAICTQNLLSLLETFDVLVDAPLKPEALSAAVARSDVSFLLEQNAASLSEMSQALLPVSRTARLSTVESDTQSWGPLCSFLRLVEPVQAFPIGTPRHYRMFRADRLAEVRRTAASQRKGDSWLDDSPWVLPSKTCWQPAIPTDRCEMPAGEPVILADMPTAMSSFVRLAETFPGSLAAFSPEGLVLDGDGAHLIISKIATGGRQYRSGAFASKQPFGYGRFEAEIKAA